MQPALYQVAPGFSGFNERFPVRALAKILQNRIWELEPPIG